MRFVRKQRRRDKEISGGTIAGDWNVIEDGKPQ
jgi:hypothetical protein